MGSNKNKIHHRNNHCRVYCKRKPGEKSSDNGTSSQMDNSRQTPEVTIEGSRVINIHKLQQYASQLASHAAQCGGGKVILSGEVRDGLASVLSTWCWTCGEALTLETAQKVKGPQGYCRWECNLAAVWGQMATGGGHSQLKETMSVLGVPVMTKKSLSRQNAALESGGKKSSRKQWWKQGRRRRDLRKRVMIIMRRCQLLQ